MITITPELHERILTSLLFAQKCSMEAGLTDISCDFEELINEIDITKEVEIKKDDKL